MKRAIVLSGGGARGAYQIGFWKALRELKIDYDIVVGVSVGAFNGALMVQNEYYKALKIWKNIAYENIYSDEILEQELYKKENPNYYKDLISLKGFGVSNLEKLVEKNINEDKIRNSEINYALVTVKFPSLKPTILAKKDIPDGKMKDYIMASATCFPVFEKKKIENDYYIDGGYYDNVPINVAIDLGADEIIAVDLKAIGLRRKTKEGAKVTLIKSRHNLGNIIDFEKDSAKKLMKLGYNDTLKTFKMLEGKYFTFEKGSLDANFNCFEYWFFNVIETTLGKKKYSFKNLSQNSKYFQKLLEPTFEKTFNEIVEYAGKLLDLDETKIYSMRRYNSSLLKAFGKKKKESESFLNKSKLEIVSDCFNSLNNPEKRKFIFNQAVLYPKEFCVAVYLKIIPYNFLKNYN